MSKIDPVGSVHSGTSAEPGQGYRQTAGIGLAAGACVLIGVGLPALLALAGQAILPEWWEAEAIGAAAVAPMLVLNMVRKRRRREAAATNTAEALQEANRLLAFQKSALDEHAIVAITDARGRITYVNDKFCQISKYSRQELLGQDHRIVNSSHHPKEFFTRMYATIAAGKPWHGEIKNRAKDGSIYWVDTTIVPYTDAHENVRGYVAIRADITDRKNGQEAIRLANDELARKNRDLEQFVYTASHDLKSPIVTIHGFLSALRKDIGEGKTERIEPIVHRLERSARRMSQTIEDLLELSRLGWVANEPVKVDMAQVVHDLVEAHEPRIRELGVHVKVEPGLPVINADPVRIANLFENLIVNALKYGCSGPRPEITIGAAPRQDEVCFYVRDNGPGIEPEHHLRVFELFKRLRTDTDGTGVGLAIVKRVAESHGGHAWVESAPGQGATFWVALPRSILARQERSAA